MYVTKFAVFEKSKKTIVWNTYNLHEIKFSASDSKICVRYDNLKFKQLLSLFWNHFGTIWPCFSYWFLVSFWGYFHIKGYYQLTNTSSDLTPFFLGFNSKNWLRYDNLNLKILNQVAQKWLETPTRLSSRMRHLYSSHE